MTGGLYFRILSQVSFGADFVPEGRGRKDSRLGGYWFMFQVGEVPFYVSKGKLNLPENKHSIWVGAVACRVFALFLWMNVLISTDLEGRKRTRWKGHCWIFVQSCSTYQSCQCCAFFSKWGNFSIRRRWWVQCASPRDDISRTPGGCLKSRRVPNPVFTVDPWTKWGRWHYRGCLLPLVGKISTYNYWLWKVNTSSQWFSGSLTNNKQLKHLLCVLYFIFLQ